MKGKKATKRALLSSALSLVLCFSMLLGTTFAWFTDEASTAVNTIQSGTLEVDIVDKDDVSLNGQEMQFVVNGNTGAPVDDDDILWEPGCTFATEGFKIVNLGNLALKYQLAINGVNGDAKLLEAIEFWITSDVDFADKTTAYDLETFVEKLEAGKTSEKIYYLVGHMDEDANNDYQDLTIEGIGVTVYATQVDAEFDSFGNDYDKEAPLPWDGTVIDGATFMAKNVNTADKVIEIYQANELAYLATPNATATVALAAGAETPITDFAGYTLKLMNDLNLGNLPWTPIDLNSATFNGQGYTIYNLNVTGAETAGLFGYASKSTILNLNVVGATVNSNHYAGAIAAHGLCAKIENCHVENAQITTAVEQVGTGWDNGDKAGGIIGYLSGEPTAYVKGCSVTDTTVVGYRDIGGLVGIANKTAEVSGNTVKDITVIVDATHNYKKYAAKKEFDANAVVGETHANATVNNNSETDVTVIAPDAAVTESNQLAGAVAAGGNVVLADGEYTMPGASNTNITISGTEKTVITVNKPAFHGSDVTLNGVTIEAQGTHTGIQHVKTVTYNDVIINGEMCLYGEKVVFNNCTFNLEKGEYLRTYGAEEAEFINCTFNTAGKAILVYKDGGQINNKITVTGCTFNATAGDKAGAIPNQNCAAIEIDNYQSNITLICSNNTVDDDFSGEWRIKTLYDNGNTVTVNGTAYSAIALDGEYIAYNQTTLEAAIAIGATKVLLIDGEYDLNGNQKDGLTLTGIGENVKVANTTKYASGKSVGAIWQKVNLENVTITNTVYTMADGGKSTFTNVTFAAGFRQGYGTGVVFNDCTFGSNSEGYALHFQTDSASEGGVITLTGCEFEGGKVHLGGKRTYEFTNCDFAAGTDFQVWSGVTLDGCTVDGVEVTNVNISTLFPNLDTEKVTLK